MRLLVTGGAGFIGSNFLHHILKKYSDYYVVNYDALTYAGHLENLDDIKDNPNYKFVKGDICDKDLVKKTVQEEGITHIVNFAAESHVDRSITGPDVFIQTNIVGTQVLLDVALEQKLELFYQISTDEVYGSLGPTGYFTEETPLAPNSPYSASKTSADLLVRAYFETYGLPSVVSRCSNNYGPYQDFEKLIPHFIKKAYHNEKVPLYGDGMNVRDWLHVQDHCEAIDVVLHTGKQGEIYNIGGNNERNNLEITKLILSGLGKSEDLISFVEDRLGHDRRYAIDASKIKNELGWEPRIKFEDGIKDTITWYLKRLENE